jgi:hypothetical protein
LIHAWLVEDRLAKALLSYDWVSDNELADKGLANKGLDGIGPLNYSDVVRGCWLLAIFLNLIHASRYPSIKVGVEKREGYLRNVIDVSDSLELTSPVITDTSLDGFQLVIWPFPANKPEGEEENVPKGVLP